MSGVLTGPGGYTIADSDGDLIGGPYVSLHGYVGVPLPVTDVVDPDGVYVADPDGTLVSERLAGNPNLIAGQLPFFLVEIEASRPAAALSYAYGWGAAPWGAISFAAAATSDAVTLRASDLGYRTETPVTVYPPRLQSGIQIDARVPLSPQQIGIVYGYGTISLINEDRQYDALVGAWNIDGRTVTIKYGVKSWDDTRGLFDDPISDDLVTLFTGVSAGWLLSEFTFDIQVRDASYWMDRQLQRTLYAGTGTYEGDAELTGTPKPKTRGRVYNIPLTLIDRANRIYQYNDGPGEVVALYEGGAETITFQADTSNLYSGSTSAGQYRTDNTRGLLQLGLDPADNAALTADVIGHFPTAGEQLIAADIVRYLIAEDIGLPSELLDTDSFDAAAAAYPYEAGWHWAPGDRVDGATAAGQCLAAFGAKIAPTIAGALQCIVLQAVAVSDDPVASYDTAQAISCEPRALPADVSPPPFRFRVAYQHNYTVQQSGLLDSATAAHRQFVQSADRYATWYDGDVETAYVNGNDVAPFGGGLNSEADAQEVADRMGALFGTRRWLFDYTVPFIEGAEREFGDVIVATYPNHAMASGARCRVLGRSLNSLEQTITLTVLV
jgi:hypothetical protein